MTTSKQSPVLKDVVAFVDVWSSDKTANYSKPFIQQLQEMGAQVSKTFNKQVTHVVFNNGHPATWRKAKKSDVQLVSVLWIGRCHDDGVHVSEELYPAVNDESNPALKNKRHRCMQPKDSPERTPENDRRMRKKLNKMMKDLALKQPVVTDVSSIIIDEENGIVYSPSLKRSEYMAKRLKDMKDKRENLSPTASQMAESSSPTSLKPSLGNTPTLLKILYNESDDDSTASVSELGYSPAKEEGRTLLDAEAQEHVEQPHMDDSMKPWLSPCRDVPLRFSSLEGKKEDKGNKRKQRKTSVRKKPAEINISLDFSEKPFLNRSPSKYQDEETSQSEIAASSPLPNQPERLKVTAAKSFTETKPHIFLDTVKSPSWSSTPAVISDAAKTSKEPADALHKVQLRTPKQATSSFSALLQSFPLCTESKNVPAASADGDDDDVFEDFFSPANCHRPKKQLLPNLPVGRNIHIPFDLGPVLTKGKQKRSESLGSVRNERKKRKLGGSQSGKNVNQQFNTSCEPESLQQQDVKESLPALDSSSADVTLLAERKRQSTSVVARTGTTKGETRKLKGASRSAEPTALTEDDTILDTQKNSEFDIDSEAFRSRGNECTEADGFTELPPDAGETHNKPVSLSLHKMVHKTKAMKTLVTTSMPTEKQHMVAQVVKALGGFSLVDRVCESTTHVVSGEHRRTLNILLGIARGCWILSFEWILWCLEQRKWVPEEPYELSDQFPAAQICRLQRHLSAGEHQQDLFRGQPPMFVSQHSQPPTQSLVELIELCGGTVCKTVRQAGICIGRYSGRRPEGSRVLSEQWVLDSITHLKRLSYDNYSLE